MDNHSQQITDYIKQHLSQGVSETDLRNHLLTNGWSQEAVNQAFNNYYGSNDVPPPMTARQPVYSQSQPEKKQKSHIIMRLAIIVVIIIVGLLALFHFLTTSTEVPRALDNLATPALQRNADNTNRENDVATIASALASYISSHQGALPQTTATDASPKTLDICGSDCTPANRVTVQLGYYANTPSAVSFHNYASTLTVPNTKTVFIVPNANCNTVKGDNGAYSGIGGSTVGQKNPNIVVLYAIQSGTSAQQQCVSLY